MNLLIFGLGYTAAHYAAYHAQAFDAVTATRRAPQGQGSGAVKLLPFDSAADQVDPRLLAALSEADALLVSAGPDAQGDPVLRRLASEIAAAPSLKKIVYLSTIGVYGDRGGGEVDESAELEPVSSRSALRVKAERDWIETGGGTRQDTLYPAPVGHLRAGPQCPGQSARRQGAAAHKTGAGFQPHPRRGYRPGDRSLFCRGRAGRRL